MKSETLADDRHDQSGKQLIGSVEGDAVPTDWVPKMIQWYREGRFPIEKLIKYFPVCPLFHVLRALI